MNGRKMSTARCFASKTQNWLILRICYRCGQFIARRIQCITMQCMARVRSTEMWIRMPFRSAKKEKIQFFFSILSNKLRFSFKSLHFSLKASQSSGKFNFYRIIAFATGTLSNFKNIWSTFSAPLFASASLTISMRSAPSPESHAQIRFG